MNTRKLNLYIALFNEYLDKDAKREALYEGKLLLADEKREEYKKLSEECIAITSELAEL